MGDQSWVYVVSADAPMILMRGCGGPMLVEATRLNGPEPINRR